MWPKCQRPNNQDRIGSSGQRADLATAAMGSKVMKSAVRRSMRLRSRARRIELGKEDLGANSAEALDGGNRDDGTLHGWAVLLVSTYGNCATCK